MSDEREGCGAHGFDVYGKPIHDYTCDDCMLPANHYDPPQINDLEASAAAQSLEQRKVQRMNGRNQLADAHGKLTAAISDYTQTYIEVATGLGLEENLHVAQSLTALAGLAIQTETAIEDQLNRDLMREQKGTN